MNNYRPPISGKELKAATFDFTAWLLKKVESEQCGHFSVFDKWCASIIERLTRINPEKDWEESVAENAADSPQGRTFAADFFRWRLFLDRWKQGRFVTYSQREETGINYIPRFGTEFGSDVFIMAQGAPHIMRWRGLPLMKTVFDFALYPRILDEISPQTLFEIGSGFGASALWFSDLLKISGSSAHVHSVDIRHVEREHEGVSFYHGDCEKPDTLFPSESLRTAPHPWLVIEDAHHNVREVLGHMHKFLKPGDYLVVEDSDIKKDAIERFIEDHPGLYMVDTRYTDYFGRNATCSNNSIFIRL